VSLSATPVILVIGEDDALVYLIERYAARAGFGLHVITEPTAAAVSGFEPAAVLFSSLESLEVARPRDTGLVDNDAPLVVCTSMADEKRARDLGADYCLLHPLTFPDFMAAMVALGVSDGRSSLAG